MNTKPPNRFFPYKTITGILIIFLLNGCTLSLFGGTTPTAMPPTPPGPTPTPQLMAVITFDATLPAPLAPGETLMLSVVDEVTGLALNAVNNPMQPEDALHYTISLPFALNSVVKYRYIRISGLPVLEDGAAGLPIRYRMYHVTGPGEVQDVVASWSDILFSGPSGRISGQVVDVNGAPIPNILMAAGGLQTLSDSLGTFSLEGLPPGTHNLVAYALDGAYGTYQQGAMVGAGQRTPVNIALTPAPLINIIFTVRVPDNTVPNVPIRLAGNLYQLGNTFGDLNGGLSTVATRMPALSPLPDGRYTITLTLPAGADVRYKYTLGDGFWNAEHHLGGEFVLRQFIVPAASAVVEDTVETWQAGPSAPILFEVTVPADTPATDIISIQFNPYGWTEPIPMWALGNNRWEYQLFSPLNMLGDFEYRYCRNDQCGSADDAATPAGRRGRPVATSLTPQDIQDEITAWVWGETPVTGGVVGVPVQPRNTDFWAGVEFQAGYHPSWQAWMTLAVQDVQGRGANWVVLTPTWTVRTTSPLDFAPLPGKDPLWADTNQTISRARAANLNVALFPAPQLPLPASDWWTSAPRSPDWWDDWFARYQAFALYHADLATQGSAQTLILGGDWLAPALPGGTLADGSLSGVPGDADGRWRALLGEVRQHFNGKVYWAAPYPGGLENAPAFISDFDGLYLLWYAPLSASLAPTMDELTAEAGRLLNGDVLEFVSSLNKPLVLAVAYPSVSSTAQACLSVGGGCLPWTTFNQPAMDNPSFTVDLQAQSDVYQALLAALNGRTWISGFVSRGYYPPVALKDESASVHGKPAADVLWYWYPHLLGISP